MASTKVPDVSAQRLAKAVGVLAIVASAVSQEYGSGINFVLVNSLGAYPAIAWLVPAAMVVAGVVLLPKVVMFMRFSQVAPRAGSTYVWLTRSLNLPVGFAVAFLWFIGVVAAMGFLAFSFASFLASTLESAGLSGAWAVTPIGHVIIGLVLIWLIFGLHYSGVGNYGAFVVLIFGIVLVAAAISIFYGFSTSQPAFLASVTKVIGQTPQPTTVQPTVSAFVSVVTLFMFAYGGITAATSLGGEARDATRTMPRGVFGGWLTALVLFSLVSWALFHAVPWWSVGPIVASKHSELATTPGLIGLVAPRPIAVLVNFLVMLIVGKTVAPEMLDSSRYLFAWAQDGMLPSSFLHTARSKAPDVALLVTAVLGSFFLLEATFFGWTIGVALRSMSLVLVFGMLGIGVLHMRVSNAFRDLPWAREVARHPDALIAAVLAIVIAVILEVSVLVVPNTPFILQPSTQAVIAILISIGIYYTASGRARRRGEDLSATVRSHLPLE